MDYVTPAGLVVTERRAHHRASEVPQIEPREHDPNPNPAVGSVGPNVPAGFGDTSVMGWHAEPWQGWPDGWATPPYGDEWSGYGYGRDPATHRVSTAITCVDLNSRQLASFPTYGVKGSTPFTLPAWSTNPEPELYGSWSEFMHAVVNCLELRGEAFCYATGRYSSSTGGYPARFVVLNPDAVAVEWIDGRREYLVDEYPVDRADICHLKYQSWPGRLHGISPLEWSARSLATSSSLEQYASRLATRGGIPWAVLKSDKNISGKQATDAQSTWVAAAARRDGAPAVIGNAFTLEALSLSPRDMALLELREFDERRICAAFGVPSYLVNVEQSSSMTYANSTDLRVFHWQATLRPLTQMIAEVWSAWLLPAGSRMEFNPDRYIQPPPSERAQTAATLFNIVDPATGQRAITIDEIRAAERLSPTGPGDVGDVDLVPAQRLTGARACDRARRARPRASVRARYDAAGRARGRRRASRRPGPIDIAGADPDTSRPVFRRARRARQACKGRTVKHHFRTALELDADGRHVYGRMFPFGEVAHVVEPDEHGDRDEYDEEFLPGCTARMRQVAASRGGAPAWIRFTVDHGQTLGDRVGYCRELVEHDDGAYGSFRLYPTADLEKVRAMLGESHTGLSIEFTDIAAPVVDGSLRRRRQINIDAVSATPIPVYESAGILAMRAGDPLDGPTPNLERVRAMLAELNPPALDVDVELEVG